MNVRAGTVVPLHNPSVAETLSVLAEAMAFRSPESRRRTLAGPHPPSAGECGALLRSYKSVSSSRLRQAILDVLAAADRSSPAKR